MNDSSGIVLVGECVDDALFSFLHSITLVCGVLGVLGGGRMKEVNVKTLERPPFSVSTLLP